MGEAQDNAMSTLAVLTSEVSDFHGAYVPGGVLWNLATDTHFSPALFVIGPVL